MSDQPHSIPTVQRHHRIDVEVMVRRSGGLPAKACSAAWSVDRDDPGRGERAARRRRTRRQEKRKRFEADADLAAMMVKT